MSAVCSAGEGVANLNAPQQSLLLQGRKEKEEEDVATEDTKSPAKGLQDLKKKRTYGWRYGSPKGCLSSRYANEIFVKPERSEKSVGG